jgi:hypothetical protein
MKNAKILKLIKTSESPVIENLQGPQGNIVQTSTGASLPTNPIEGLIFHVDGGNTYIYIAGAWAQI